MSTLTLNNRPRWGVPPATSPEQKQAALEKATSVKNARTETKRRVRELGRRDGAHELATVISEPSREFGSLMVWQAVQWVPQLGEEKTKEMLRASGIDPWCKVRRMTVRQREALTAQLVMFADGVPRPVTRARRERSGFRGPRCSGCGEHMRSASEDGRCGFCIESQAA